MKCYNHHDRDAFGVCVNCGKGLCLECMNENSAVVACNDKNCVSKFKHIKIARMILYILLAVVITLLIFD